MKFIIIGLGNFGSALAVKLTEGGHEVIGVDNNENHINLLQGKLTHILKMDSTIELAIDALPLNDTDAVVIAIGEDSGASITTAAILKKRLPNCKIVARANSDIHNTIFEAMGIQDIINPEAAFADQFAQRLTIAGNLKSFILNDQYEIAECKVPASFVGKTVKEIQMIKNWNLSLVTIIHHSKRKNLIGREVSESKVTGVVDGDTVLKENDTLVLFGPIHSFEKMMDKIGRE